MIQIVDVKAETNCESNSTSCDWCENENSKDLSFFSSDSSLSCNKSEQPLAYPKQVFLIIGNEFCERFNYYGMRSRIFVFIFAAKVSFLYMPIFLSNFTAILAVYISSKLHTSDREATLQYHTFNALVYFTCIFGSIISDTWLGKFKTILYLYLSINTQTAAIRQFCNNNKIPFM